MKLPLYTACIGEAFRLAENTPYDTLLKSIVEFTVRAALARSIDDNEWEHEELRRKGLGAVQIFRNGRAVWTEPRAFEAELAEARRERIEPRFNESNELDPELYSHLDRDLQVRWRTAGYQVPSLLNDMKKLFSELERDAADRATGAREALVDEILKGDA